MALRRKTISIVGCGPGGPDFITPAARRCIEQASVLAGTQRLLDMFPESRAKQVVMGSHLESGINQLAPFRGERIAVLVTGDPGLCSLSRHVIRHFGRSACRVIPGISSIQAAFAAIGEDWQDVRVINAHHGIPAVDPRSLAGTRKLAILGGHRDARPWMAEVATALGAHTVLYVCERLTMPTERIRRVNRSALKNLNAADPHVVLMIKEKH